MRSDSERLRDAIEAIDRITEHVGTDRDAFATDELRQAAVIRWIEVIGEAANGLSSSFRETHADVPWREVVDMRNRVSHGYFDVDIDVVWATVQTDLPDLRTLMRAWLAEKSD